MRNIRKLSIFLALCLVLCALPVASAHAAESGSMWLRHLPQNDGVSLSVCADTAVASGVITITYDSSLLAFQGLTVDSTYVLAHAVNDKETGKLHISWIGTGTDSGAYVLMTLEFAGVPDQSSVLNGTVYDASGNTIAITTLNLTGVTAAVMQAETLKAEDYTAVSFASVQTALQEANDLLDQVTTTQAQLDAATQALVTAMDKLVVYTPEPPATEPQPTEPAPTEPVPTEPKPSDKPTQPGSQPKPTEPVVADPVPKKNDTLLIVGVALALCAVVAIAAVVILKKRGRK